MLFSLRMQWLITHVEGTMAQLYPDEENRVFNYATDKSRKQRNSLSPPISYISYDISACILHVWVVLLDSSSGSSASALSLSLTHPEPLCIIANLCVPTYTYSKGERVSTLFFALPPLMMPLLFFSLLFFLFTLFYVRAAYATLVFFYTPAVICQFAVLIYYSLALALIFHAWYITYYNVRKCISVGVCVCVCVMSSYSGTYTYPFPLFFELKFFTHEPFFDAILLFFFFFVVRVI